MLWAKVSTHKIRKLIDLQKIPYFSGYSFIAMSNMNAYEAFILLSNIFNNISFSHHSNNVDNKFFCYNFNTIDNIYFSYYCNTITKSTILSIVRILRVLHLNYCIIFCFTYTCKLNKYITYLTQTNSIVLVQMWNIEKLKI